MLLKLRFTTYFIAFIALEAALLSFLITSRSRPGKLGKPVKAGTYGAARIIGTVGRIDLAAAVCAAKLILQSLQRLTGRKRKAADKKAEC